MSKASWADEQAARIGATIKALRDNRSGQWLSDKTAELGHRVSRTTISEIENGKRKSVSTAELSVLAEALQVPPLYLLYPQLPDGEVEVVPGRPMASATAWKWFSGDGGGSENRVWHLIYASSLRETQKQYLAQITDRNSSMGKHFSGDPADLQGQIDFSLQMIDRAERMIREAGGTLADGR